LTARPVLATNNKTKSRYDDEIIAGYVGIHPFLTLILVLANPNEH
jgi:hypothetical protein